MNLKTDGTPAMAIPKPVQRAVIGRKGSRAEICWNLKCTAWRPGQFLEYRSFTLSDSPVANEIYPSLAFDNLFENRGSLRNQSVLDRVKDRAETLSLKVSSSDRAKLDEYLTSVREVEKRIERMRNDKA